MSYNNGDSEKSLGYFRKAARLDPENPEVWYLMGRVHYLKGETKNSVSCLREALKLDAFFADVWVELGKILFAEKLVERALPYLEKAYKITGDVPGINYILAAFYLRIRKREKAFEHLVIAVELDKEIYQDFSIFFPEKMLSKKMKEFLKENL
jgi:tetratricopeptide (TPR) repeat protein